MTDRELNLAICKEIEQVAVKTWEQVKEKMQEGSYTANQVNDEKERFGNLDMEMATVEVGTFRCEFPICESFRLLHQFYRLCGTKDKDRVRFTYMKKKQVLLDAEILIDKQHKVLEKMVESDGSREIMMFPYLDVKRSMIVASDGKVLGAFQVGITVYSGNAEGVSLPVKMVAKPGVYHVTAYGDGSCLAVGKGVSYSCKLDGNQRYPSYIGVINAVTLSQERHYCVTAEGVKTLEKFFKSLKSVPGNGAYYKGNHKCHNVRLYARNGEQTIHVQFKDEDSQNELTCDIPMSGPCRGDLHITLSAEHTMRLLPAWNGSFWYQDMTRIVMFDTDTEDTMLLAPCLDDHPQFAVSSERKGETMVKWEERYNQRAEAPKRRSTEMPKQNAEAPKRGAEAPKQKQSKQTFNFMSFYTIDQLASGTYEVCGEKRELLDRDIRLMGRYLMEHPDLFRKSQEYFNKTFGQGEVARKRFPLQDEELWGALNSSLLMNKVELEEIRKLYAEAPKQDAEAPKRRSTESPKQNAEAQRRSAETPKQDAVPEPMEEENQGIVIERTREVIGRRFYPMLVVTQGDVQIRVAGNALYQAIADKDGTIAPHYMELFNSIDAFITDELLLEDPLDEQAICQEIEEFFNMLEEVERMNQFTI